MVSIEQGAFKSFIQDVKNLCEHPRSKKARGLVETTIASFERTILKAQDQRPVEEIHGLTIEQMLNTTACMAKLREYTRDSRKIHCIKWVRRFTGMGLRESKEYVEATWHNWK